MAIHSLLARQLREHDATGTASDVFLTAVSNAYDEFDADRGLLERSLELSSQELLQANAEMRAVFQAFPDLFYWIDESGKILNRRGGSSTDLYRSGADILGKTIQSIPNAAAADKFNRALTHVRTLRTMASIEYSMEVGSTSHWYEARLLPLVNKNIIVIIRNISALKRTEAALTGSEQRYRLLFDRNPQPMWVFDLQTLSFLAVNEAAIRHYGYSHAEFMSMNVRDMRPPEDIPGFLASLSNYADGHCESGERRHRVKVGREIDVEVTSHKLEFSGRPAVIELAHDITERKRLESNLRQSQKMDAVGRLAGGVAHDFNNLLTVIKGYCDLFLRSSDSQTFGRPKVEAILAAADRAAALTRQLLTFSRQEIFQPRVIDVNTVIVDLDRMLRRLIGEDIELVTKPAPGLGKTQADAGQLEQVIMNLVVNARDAMPQGGRLTIETGNFELDESFCRRHPNATPGPHVILTVSDTGCGMDPTVRSRIFEPFFTTKEQGRGTGLGLSMVYGIVKQSNGYIWVYTEPGLGTTFRIFLPRVDTAGVDNIRALHQPVPHGHETILLVEDDDALREMIEEILTVHSYRVLAARNGQEALKIVKEHPEPIPLMLTDVVMPGMSGRELGDRMSVSNPEMRVVFMSGYTDDAVVRHGVLEQSVAFIQKPFAPAALARKLREVLENPWAATGTDRR